MPIGHGSFGLNNAIRVFQSHFVWIHDVSTGWMRHKAAYGRLYGAYGILGPPSVTSQPAATAEGQLSCPILRTQVRLVASAEGTSVIAQGKDTLISDQKNSYASGPQ